MDAEHPVDGGQHLPLVPPLGLDPLGGQPAQIAGALAQQGLQGPVHRPGRGGAVGLRHGRLGDQAVLGDQGDEHVPLAAVTDRIRQQVCHRAVVHVPVRRLDDGLQEVVRPLELVPPEQVVLGELEVLHAQLPCGADPEQVEPGEHPATPALLLVGGLPVVQVVGDRVVDAGEDPPVEGDIVHGCLGDRVLHQPVHRARGELLLEQLVQIRGQTALHGLVGVIVSEGHSGLPPVPRDGEGSATSPSHGGSAGVNGVSKPSHPRRRPVRWVDFCACS